MPESTDPIPPTGRGPRGRIASFHLALALFVVIEVAGLLALVFKLTTR